MTMQLCHWIEPINLSVLKRKLIIKTILNLNSVLNKNRNK